MSAELPQADKPPNGRPDLGHETANEDPATSASTSKYLGLLTRTDTNTAEIDSTITHPGSVKINVQGAFIVDQDPESPKSKAVNGGSHDTKDIRLPNHTAVVSHIAVDVCLSPRLRRQRISLVTD